ncbi:hypothetical protein CJD36_010865 [Flavipsychrobacter stenotrophus]|uniref:Uncharacterized protein n=1 Tax=Flavipsychrobacter stenotrophus TaxID=2077091 RepID=A0A2S7SU75_9BACT|nr:hypothetical protein [Flavipsychrobacter stenotrophus]PQJ10469.1 hypothetical protein CJD36_010865 [Flavipsychrobacter stenotrophus]
MKLLRPYLVVLFMLLSVSVQVAAQQIDEKLLVRDAGDSLLLKAFRAAFDTSGNYYFETLLPGKGDRFAMITNKTKHDPVFWGQNIASTAYKALVADAFFTDSTRKKIWYKNKSGTKIYGPHAGRIREVLEYGKNNVAVEMCIGAKSYLYINDSMVNETDSLHQLWLCAFSDNGHCLYTVYKKDMFRLYLDHQQVDSAEEMFSEIAVNNNKFYTYVKPQGGKYYIHTPAQRYGPFGIVEYSDLWNNNAWYYRGCVDSQCYILVNGKLIDKIPEAHTTFDDGSGNTVYKSDEQIAVQPYSAENYLVAYNQNNDNGTFLNVNGKVSHHNYSYLGFIFSDKKDGYAFYGSRKDSIGAERTYKNINGKEIKLPSFRRARYRPHTMQIDPDGSSLYYYETADSMYLFRNDTLLCKPVNKKRFLVWDATVLPQIHPDGLEYFQGINADGASYIIYNNKLSRPLPLILPKYDRLDEPQRGSIVAGDLNHNGFYIIENTAPGKYLLVINNTIYKELEGIDRILGDQGYLNDHSLVFYGTKGSGFYQFTAHF